MAKVRRKGRPIEKQSSLAKLRHSASHVLAAAVLRLYPKTRLGIGPATREGFYYDFRFDNPISETELSKIEQEMRRIIRENHPFKKSEKSIAAALKWARDEGQIFKEELIEDLQKAGEKKVSFYASGDFTDLCAGPHLKKTGDIKAFRLISLAGAYFKGDERNPMLTRIYGTAFPTQTELEDYLKKLEKAKQRDHRLVGEKLELFSFHQTGPAFPFWQPKGTTLINLITDYLRQTLNAAGYQEIRTPLILSEELWRKSGHFEHYRENMYFTEIEGKRFAVRPMNCPGAVILFKDRMRSYRDLPLRFSEFGLVHRHELSGVLHGLFRTRAFTQDDAHIFCAQDAKEIKREIKTLIGLIQKIYRDFGFKTFHLELSTRPPKSIGSDAIWQMAEKVMKEIVKEEKLKAQENVGEGAFYGPKFDFHVEDSLGRSWQLGTIQLDFSMPERLGAFYIDKQGNKQTPVMIHRALLGSLERFIGILLEHHDGALPFWLSPLQVILLPVGEKHLAFSQKTAQTLKTAGFRAEVDKSDTTVGKKVRNAELQKIPYILVIGEKEVRSQKLAVRKLGRPQTRAYTLLKFLVHLSLQLPQRH